MRPSAPCPISSAASWKLHANPPAANLEAFFLPLTGGRRFCLLHSPPDTPRGAIVFVHPFAEEMNRCRRMAALQSRAFAADGYAVLQIDLLGCGDSEGEFGDATWGEWLADVVAAAQWLRSRVDRAPILWGLRTGALLACAAADRIEASALLLWQPVLSGKQFLQQFLRLKAAGEMVQQSDRERTSTRSLRDRLERGEAVEIAGYSIAPELALGLEAADLDPPSQPMRTVWLEVAASADLTPASQARVQQWQAAGHAVDARAVEGPLFWQTLNITEAPALIYATRAMVSA